jgi:hypothetical protein
MASTRVRWGAAHACLAGPHSFTVSRQNAHIVLTIFPQICLFYVVLRALDTVEDDMTIPDDVKQSVLRSFHQNIVTPGWNFTGSGPKEKDAVVLVDFANCVEELLRLEPECVMLV